MDKKLKPGDWVRLKTGGPVMTIFEVSEVDAFCRWLNGKNLEAATFKLADLEPSNANPEQ